MTQFKVTPVAEEFGSDIASLPRGGLIGSVELFDCDDGECGDSGIPSGWPSR